MLSKVLCLLAAAGCVAAQMGTQAAAPMPAGAPTVQAASASSQSVQSSSGGGSQGKKPYNPYDYCQVSGYPRDKFKVGCSYEVKGNWNCYRYSKMTVWCVRQQGYPRAYYCCGDSCRYYQKPKKCGSKPPPPPPPPVNDCSQGKGKSAYDLGASNGQSTMRTTFDSIGNDCSQLDSIYKTTSGNAPEGYCLGKGWRDGAKKQYQSLQSGCISDCAGSGQSTGQSLGSQFCQVTQLVAAAAAQKSPTVQICNSVEVTNCQVTYDSYVTNNCPDQKAANFGQYQNLRAICKIT